MVTQEGDPSTNEEERNQDRRSLTAAAIRRGDINISEPILWVEGVPDAPSTQPPRSNVVPPKDAATEQQTEEDQVHGFALSTNEEQPASSSGDHPHLRHERSSQYIRGRAESRNYSTPADVHLEQRSSAFTASLDNQGQMQGKKKRRSGTIRTVFRKVFGKREKSRSKDMSPSQSRSGPKHEYTRSDPLPTTTPKATGAKPEAHQVHQDLPRDPLRSLPADEYSSHTPVPAILPFPMNVNAPEPSSTPQNTVNYISFETSPKVHRRRATLPSMVLSPADTAALQKMWSSTDLPISPSKSASNGIPSPLIGVAVTSSANPNRRSRSAGALHEMAKMQKLGPGLRRRSSEIRYWRMSSQEQPEPERTVSRESSICRSTKASTIASIQPSMTEVSDALADTGSSIRDEPVQSFDFGSVTTERNVAEKSASVVEQRLSQLEFNMQHLSFSLHEVSHRTDRQTFILEKPPSSHKSQPSFTASRHGLPANPKDPVFPQRAASKRFTQSTLASSAPETSPLHSKVSHHPSFLTSPSSSGVSPSLSFTPAQFQTPRPSTSSAIPQTPRTAPLPQSVLSQGMYDQLAPLYSALRYERTVRKALEAQVIQLRHDVLELGTVVGQLRGTQAYPTPSPDQIMTEGPSIGASRFSGYDSDDEGNGRRRVASPGAEVAEVAEVWRTPREELTPKAWPAVSEGEMF